MKEHSTRDGNPASSATPYDDVFRTLIVTCRDLLYPLLNEVFGENYDDSIRIDFHQNEHFMEQQDGGEEKIITDESFDVLDHSDHFLKKYHLECQAYPDNSLCLRFFEYDSQIAKETGVIEGDTLTVTFPNSAVIFLRSSSSTPDHLYIRIVTSDGELKPEVKVLKLQDYTIEDLLSHQLYLLVPFAMFLYEKQLPEFEADEEKRAELEAVVGSLIDDLNGLVEVGKISSFQYDALIAMLRKTNYNILKKEPEVQKGVEAVMGGHVLDFPGKKEYEEGVSRGFSQGISQGQSELIVNALNKGSSPEQISAVLNISLDEVKKLSGK